MGGAAVAGQRMKLLVTGGGGFLGQALCRGLVERGHDVTSFNRGHYPVLDALGVRQIAGDLADRGAVLAALAGADAVFHNAAKAGAWGSYDSYYRANVIGTRNVLDACRAHGIGKLIYIARTSPQPATTFSKAVTNDDCSGTTDRRRENRIRCSGINTAKWRVVDDCINAA